uniref:Uncharacterized protein n=1 Tax=Timema genevievae TaxID=629358 RepID=A0A7R9K100_TIMGE|nr:unnamed protein product [Timema genevievae]
MKENKVKDTSNEEEAFNQNIVGDSNETEKEVKQEDVEESLNSILKEKENTLNEEAHEDRLEHHDEAQGPGTQRYPLRHDPVRYPSHLRLSAKGDEGEVLIASDATVSVLRHNLMKPIHNAPENTAEVMTSCQKMAVMPSAVMAYDAQNERIRARPAGLLFMKVSEYKVIYDIGCGGGNKLLGHTSYLRSRCAGPSRQYDTILLPYCYHTATIPLPYCYHTATVLAPYVYDTMPVCEDLKGPRTPVGLYIIQPNLLSLPQSLAMCQLLATREMMSFKTHSFEEFMCRSLNKRHKTPYRDDAATVRDCPCPLIWDRGSQSFVVKLCLVLSELTEYISTRQTKI